jgi:dTDP-4-dehydrorhamnose 3,5-epimerase
MPFRFERLEIPELVFIQAQRFEDNRGFFLETYRASEFAAHGIPANFVQDNLSHSVHGVLRGLHYQKRPKAQGKLVMVLSGEILDVAVDIRRGSPTYGRWAGVRLSADRGDMIYVPAGFAHGFCVISQEAKVLYKVTDDYAPKLDRGIVWNDPAIGIKWPTADPVLSKKDAQLPLLKDADHNFEYGAP